MVVDAQHPPPWWAFSYTIFNNIINKYYKQAPLRLIMASSVYAYTQLNDNEREWFAYFMESYTKEQMIIKYIAKVKELNVAEGGRDGVLCD